MHYLLPLGLLLLSLNLSAQVTPDSLLHSTKVGQQVAARKDSLDLRIQRAQGQLDSLRRLPRRTVDSSAVVQYAHRQRDSLQQRIHHWQARKDSLLSPLDTLRQKARSFSDSLNQRIPVGPATDALRSVAAEQLPDELTSLRSVAAVKERVPELSIPRVVPQRPDLPPPVHAIREHAAVWQEKLRNYSGKLSDYQGQAAVLAQGSQVVEKEALDQVARHTLEGQQLPEGLPEAESAAATTEQQRAELQQRLLASARDHFAQHQPELQQAQQQLADLKRKYSLVQGEQHQKHNSLQGTPLSERLVYGGTMQINRTPALAVDLSPRLGYQLNKRFTAGLGATYRLTLSEDYWAAIRKSITMDNAVYGGRAYLEYEVIRSFLLHGEYERMSQAVPTVGQDGFSRRWNTSLLAGIGKSYPIAGKWRGSVLLLYNFRHGKQNIHARPWVLRFGFQRGGD